MILDDLTVERVTGADGRPMWRFSDGAMLPVVRGGDGPDSDTGDTGSDTGDTGSGDTGDTGSDTGDTGSGDAPTADDLAKWKAMARKHEAESKKARAELDKLKAAGQTDAEKAIADAEARGRQAATADVAQRLAGAEIKAALSGVVPDPAAIVEDLNLAKYVDADGDVDSDAVAALRTKYEGLSKAKSAGNNPLGQGAKGEPAGKDQLTQADLAKMTPEQIVKARKDGRLADLYKGIGRSGDYR